MDCAQFRGQHRRPPGAYFDVEDAAVRVSFRCDSGLLPLEGLHDMAGEVRCISDGQGFHEQGFADPSLGDGMLAGHSIGFNQSTDAEFGASEIAHHRNEGPVQVMGPEDTMDGSACAAGGLTVIGGAEPIRTELPGETDVTGGAVLRMDGFQGPLDGLFCCAFIGEGKREGVSVKFAALGLVEADTIGGQCGKCVPDAQLRGLRMTLYT